MEKTESLDALLRKAKLPENEIHLLLTIFKELIDVENDESFPGEFREIIGQQNREMEKEIERDFLIFVA
jgi:hypothetical protein